MNDNHSKTVKYFNTLIKYGYYCGLPNFSSKDDECLASPCFAKLHGVVSKAVNILMCLLIIFEMGGIITQKELSRKQATDLYIMCFSHPILYVLFLSVYYQKTGFKDLIYELSVKLKRVSNDEETERKMIRQMKVYSCAVCAMISSSLISYGFDGILQVYKNDSTFTTLITYWPDVHDKTLLAVCARVVIYIVWWISMIRTAFAYVYVISLTVCLSYQYKNLICYFRGLTSIFEDKRLSRIERERKYVNGFKAGLMVHSETLSCTEKIEKACSFLYGGEVLINVFVVGLLLSQMVHSERTFMNILPVVSTCSCLLMITGFFMCTAGDVTVEASAIPNAMFYSGWQGCLAGSFRVRVLLVVAIAQGQKPVVLSTLGTMELSYESYVSIVKSTYSLFSLLY